MAEHQKDARNDEFTVAKHAIEKYHFFNFCYTEIIDRLSFITED